MAFPPFNGPFSPQFTAPFPPFGAPLAFPPQFMPLPPLGHFGFVPPAAASLPQPEVIVELQLPPGKTSAASAIASEFYRHNKIQDPVYRGYLAGELAHAVTFLDLSGCTITNEMIADIAGLFPNLEQIYTYATHVDITKLQAALPKVFLLSQKRTIPLFVAYKGYIRRIFEGTYNKGVVPESVAWGKKHPELLPLLDQLYEKLPIVALEKSMKALTIESIDLKHNNGTILSIITAFLIEPFKRQSCEEARECLLHAGPSLSDKTASLLAVCESALTGAVHAVMQGTIEHSLQKRLEKGLQQPPTPAAAIAPQPSSPIAPAAGAGAAAKKVTAPNGTAEQNLLEVDLSTLNPPAQKIVKWVAKFADKHPKAESLILHEACAVTSELTEALKAFKHLKTLTVRNAFFNDEGCVALAQMPLQEIILYHTAKCTKRGFAVLSKGSFQTIHLTVVNKQHEPYYPLLLETKTKRTLVANGLSPECRGKLQALATKQGHTLRSKTATEMSAILDTALTALQAVELYKEAQAILCPPGTLDLRSLGVRENFHRELPLHLGNLNKKVTRLRLPICALDRSLIEVIDKSGISEVNLGLCHTIDFQRLAQSTIITTILNAFGNEDDSQFIWADAATVGKRNEYLFGFLMPQEEVHPITFDASRIQAFARIQQLQHLDIGNAPLIGDKAIAPLAQLSQLRALIAARAPITEAGIKALHPLGQKLRALTLMYCEKLGDAGIAAISAIFPLLEELKLELNELTDQALPAICKLKHLKTLMLGTQPALTLQGMKVLVELQTLEKLLLVHDQFSDEFVLHLIEKMPKLHTLQLMSRSNVFLSPHILDRAAQLKKTIHQISMALPPAVAAAAAAADQKTKKN